MNHEFPEAEPPPAPAGAARNGVITQLLSLARALATSRYRYRLGLLAAGIVFVIGANAAGQIRLNVWQGDFYDAIEQRHVPAFAHQLLVFLVIAGGLRAGRRPDLAAGDDQRQAAGVAHPRPARPVARTQARLSAELRRRDREQSGSAHPPGFAASDRLTTSLAIGLLQSTLLLASFVGVLWVLSEQVVFEIGGRSLAIPGYMVWCALAYSLGGSLLAWRVGRPLVALNAERYAREADLRFALVRVNEHAAGISLYGGEADERRVLDEPVDRVVTVMARLGRPRAPHLDHLRLRLARDRGPDHRGGAGLFRRRAELRDADDGGRRVQPGAVVAALVRRQSGADRRLAGHAPAHRRLSRHLAGGRHDRRGGGRIAVVDAGSDQLVLEGLAVALPTPARRSTRTGSR